jgi:hypothetical protein
MGLLFGGGFDLCGDEFFEACDFVLCAVVIFLLEDEDEDDVEIGLDEIFFGGEGGDGLGEVDENGLYLSVFLFRYEGVCFLHFL